jgi:hypothetical protein
LPVSDGNYIIPPGSVNWCNAERSQVLPIYADLVGRKLDQPEAARFPITIVVFKNQTPLSKADFAYAIEVLLESRRIMIVPEGVDHIKPAFISSRQNFSPTRRTN